MVEDELKASLVNQFLREQILVYGFNLTEKPTNSTVIPHLFPPWKELLIRLGDGKVEGDRDRMDALKALTLKDVESFIVREGDIKREAAELKKKD